MIVLSNLLAIARKESLSYLTLPFSYVVAAIFWLLAGQFLEVMLLGPQGAIQSIARLERQGVALPPIDAAYEFIRLYLSAVGSLVLFVCPVLSMGLYTEERKRGTMELLATSPLSNWVVAAGKLLGVTVFFGVLTLPLLAYEAFALGAADPPVALTLPLLAHGGLLLLSASMLSLGMFVSSLTDSTLLAAIGSFALAILLWTLDLVGDRLGGPVGEILIHLSLLRHYNLLVRGTLDTGSLILFGSYILLGVFLTALSVEAFRFVRR